MGSGEASLTLNVNGFFFSLYFYIEIITVIFTLLSLQREFSLRVLGSSLVVQFRLWGMLLTLILVLFAAGNILIGNFKQYVCMHLFKLQLIFIKVAVKQPFA